MNRKTTIQRWFLLFAAAIMLFGTQVTAQELVITPDPLDLGERPIESWMRSEAFTLTNTSTDAITLTRSDLDAPAFFSLDAATYPVTIPAGGSFKVFVNTQGTATIGLKTGKFVAGWESSRNVTVAEMLATAYVPVQGDVFENPFEIAAFPFNAAGVSTTDFRDNYLLTGTATDGFDAVYSFTLATDQLISVNLTGADAKMAIYTPFGINEGPGAGNELYAAEDVAANLELFAGDYYLVVSTTDASYDLDITAVAMPAPEAVTIIAPLDGAVDVTNNDVLSWTYGANTLEYQVVLGTTYPPATVVVDWADAIPTTHQLAGLQPNLQYFWQVNVRNNNTTTVGSIWGFTTTLTPPSALTAEAEIYVGENVVLTWESPANRALLGYNVFRDGVQLNTTMLTAETYTNNAPAYNMTGYAYTVTAIFDEGESAPSDPFTVQVSGKGTLMGNVKDLNTSANIEGATVAIVGVDEFGENRTYTATTFATGNYTADVLAGIYDLTVTKDGYITAEMEDVVVTYNTTTTENFILLETAYPVAVVTASEFGENILIEWSFDAVNFAPQVYPFDTEGMSEEVIQKSWNEFLDVNNFDATAQGSDRALVEFEVWRMREYLPGTMEMIGTTSQYQFVDFDWSVQDWGVYKWYVKAIYDLSESDAVASNSQDKDMLTVVDLIVALNSADSPGGTVVTFTNTSEPTLNLEYGIVLGSTGEHEWNAFRKGSYNIEVSKSGYAVVTETADIYDATSFEWLLEELLATPADLYVTPTAYATWGAGVAVAFEPMVQDFNDGFGDWTVEQSNTVRTWVTKESSSQNIDGTPYAYVQWTSNPQNELLVSPVLNATSASSLYIQFEQYYRNLSGSDIGTVEVYDGSSWVTVATYQGQSYGSWTTANFQNIDVTAYKNANFQLRFRYIAHNDWYWAIDNVVVTDVPVAGRSFATYKLFLDEVLLGELSEEEYQLGTTFGETLTAGETYLVEVAAVYTTGQSDKAAFSFIYVPCEDYAAPANFAAAQVLGTLDIELTWNNVNAAALDTVAGVVISRNGEEYAAINFDDGVVASFTDSELEFGTYTYCITYIYDSGAETCQGVTCTEDVVITGGGYVNGTVTAFDGGAGIQGATVTAFNDDFSFEFTTNAAGLYTGEVVDGTYDYLVVADTYESQTLEGVVITFGETVTNDFVLLEFPYAVEDVIATELSDDVVQVDWSGTGGGGGGTGEEFFEGFEDGNLPTGWVVYDVDGDSYNWENSAITYDIFEPHTGLYCMTSASYLNGIGALTPNNWLVTPAIEAGDASMLSFWVAGQDPAYAAEKYYVKVSTSGNQVADFTTTLHTAVATGVWSEVTVDLSAFAGETIYIAFQHADISDMYFIKLDDVAVTNTPTRAAYTEPVLAGNSTAVPFKTAGMTAEAIDAKLATIEANSNRELVGYSVYRTTCETGDLQFLGLTLDEQFTDNAWGGVTSGVYKWGVVAEYSNNESEVVFSNCLDKDMLTTVSVTVTTNSGDSPEGTNVSFTNTSEPDLDLTYATQLDETGYFAWDDFRKGTYDIYAEKLGFGAIEISDYVIDSPEAFVWMLEELLLPVSDLYVSPTGFATWRGGGVIPFEPFIESFDGLANGQIPEGWTKSPETAHWGVANTNAAGGTAPEMKFYYSPTYNGELALMTPSMSTIGQTELTLSFNTYLWHYSASYAYSVKVVAIADGVEHIIEEWSPVTANIPVGLLSYDLTAAHGVGATDFQIAWIFYGDSFGIYNWNIDDVMLYTPGSRELQGYKVWLDGIYKADTPETYYQYDVTNLVDGEEYFAEVAAVYSNGISEKMNYTWTYMSCDNYAGPEDLAAEVNGQDVTLTWGGTTPPPPPGDGFEDDFEGHANFVIDFAPWTNVDVDGSTTYGMTGITWPNAYDPQSFIIYNPSATSPELPDVTAHSGSKFAACFAAVTAPNNDWLIAPKTAIGAGYNVNFWAKSYVADYGLERFKVGVSTTGTNPADFTIITPGSFVEAPASAWTEFSYDLSAYAGQEVYVGINCVSNDAFFLMVDDFSIGTQAASFAFNNAPAVVGTATRALPELPVVTNFDPAMAALLVDSKAFTGETTMNREVGVLWGDNWEEPQTTTQGIVSTYFGGLDAPTYSADDFTVPAGKEWVVSSLWARGFLSAGVPSPEGFGYTIFADANGAPGAVLYEEINAGANNPDQVEIDLDTPITLTEGTYWIAFYAYYQNATGTTQGRWNQYMWNPATTPGNPAMLNDIAELFGGTGGFVTLTSLGVEFSSLDFAIVGESQDAGGGPGGDIPEGVVGVNVYRDGMLIAEAVQGNIYVDENVDFGAYTYCITYVYEDGGESCLTECVDVDLNVTCDAPKALTGEYLWTTDAWGAKIEWNSPVNVVADWLFYDDGVNVDGIGGPATFTWAIKFDPAQLADYDGASLTKIMIYNRTAPTNELRIYEGTNAATLLHTQPLSGLGMEVYEEVTLTSPVLLDVTKQLWIAVYTTDGANYPASTSNYAGNPNSDLITQDGGASWDHLNDLGLPYSWNLRGYVTTVAGATASLPMDKPVDQISNSGESYTAMGKPGAQTFFPDATSREGRELELFNVYRSTNNVNYELIGTVPFEEGVSSFGYFDTDLAAQTDYYYQVTAFYNMENATCESEPAMAQANPENDFVVVFVTNVNELGTATARLYPNPATESVTIEAANMNRITVINAIGQVVYDREISGESTQLNIAAFEAGIYMVRINTENGMVTKRMSIVR